MKALLAKVQAQLPQLSPVNRALADYVLTDAEAFIAQTTAQIARASGVSAASVIRFVRLFDYPDLQSFKLALVRDTQAPALTPLDPLVQDDDDLPTHECVGVSRPGFIFKTHSGRVSGYF